MPRGGTLSDARQADLIAGVVRQAQISDDVLDLPATVEALRPDQLVGQVGVQESLFKEAGLGVGAVHHGKVARAYLLARLTRLVMVSTTKGASPTVVVGLVQDDLLPRPPLGEEALGRA